MEDRGQWLILKEMKGMCSYSYCSGSASAKQAAHSIQAPRQRPGFQKAKG